MGLNSCSCIDMMERKRKCEHFGNVDGSVCGTKTKFPGVKNYLGGSVQSHHVSVKSDVKLSF